MIDSLTFADYIGLVDFDSDARTMKGLNFLAPAAAGFRDEAKIFIDQLEDSVCLCLHVCVCVCVGSVLYVI